MARQRSMALVLEALRRHKGHLTEAQAAQLLGVGSSWFRHDFKRHSRVSFRTARLQAKLAYGADLLTATDLSIPEISTLLGYSDRTKFEKAFKRAYDLTPTVYRHLHASQRTPLPAGPRVSAQKTEFL